MSKKWKEPLEVLVKVRSISENKVNGEFSGEYELNEIEYTYVESFNESLKFYKWNKESSSSKHKEKKGRLRKRRTNKNYSQDGVFNQYEYILDYEINSRIIESVELKKTVSKENEDSDSKENDEIEFDIVHISIPDISKNGRSIIKIKIIDSSKTTNFYENVIFKFNKYSLLNFKLKKELYHENQNDEIKTDSTKSTDEDPESVSSFYRWITDISEKEDNNIIPLSLNEKQYSNSNKENGNVKLRKMICELPLEIKWIYSNNTLRHRANESRVDLNHVEESSSAYSHMNDIKEWSKSRRGRKQKQKLKPNLASRASKKNKTAKDSNSECNTNDNSKKKETHKRSKRRTNIDSESDIDAQWHLNYYFKSVEEESKIAKSPFKRWSDDKFACNKRESLKENSIPKSTKVSFINNEVLDNNKEIQEEEIDESPSDFLSIWRCADSIIKNEKK